MNIVKLILQIVIAAIIGYYGTIRLIGTAEMIATFQSFNYAEWFMRLVGVLEIGSALCLVINAIAPKYKILINVAGFIIMILTIGAVCSHFFRQKNIGEGLIPLAVAILTVILLMIHNRNAPRPFIIER